MRFEVGRLRELFVAPVKWAYVRSVTRVDPDVGSEVEVQREPLTTALKRALEGLLARVNKLMPFQFGALDEGLAALGADVNTGPMGVQVLPHGGIVAKHFGAPLVGAGNGSRYFLGAGLSLRFDSGKSR